MRTAILGAAVLTALALSGCGAAGGGPAEPSETAAATEQAPPPTTTPAPEPSEEATLDDFADSARTTSWASDEAMDIDGDGNGTIPAASLEADLVDLFKNKFDMAVDKAECDQDMSVLEWYGFQACTVFDKEMTYFGTVELVDHKDEMVKYEVVFPGVDKGDTEFSD